jgi:small-conductance mechanosensitive channel
MGFMDVIQQLRDNAKHFPWEKAEKVGLVFLTCLAILFGVKLVAKAVRKAVDDGDDSVTSDAERRADTLAAVLMNTAKVAVAGFFVLMLLSEFGVNIGPLVAGASVAGVALGFGAQALVKDVISGFFMLMENIYGVGDIISVDDKHVGTVERMTLRVTLLRDSEGKAHYLPNGSITRVVVLSKEFARALVEIDVAYGTDLERASALLSEVGAELATAWPDRVLEATEVKGVERLSSSGITLRTLTKTAPGKQFEVGRELRKRIAERFHGEGIALFPPTTVMMRS